MDINMINTDRPFELYNKFSDYLVMRYGEKVYKLPINLPLSCPNRDGTVDTKGCSFCGDEGAGFETLESSLSVEEQLNRNSEYIKNKYKAKKFIAYFQNYSNTYVEYHRFVEYINQAVKEDVVAIYISTRPDCINDSYLGFLQLIKEQKGVDIIIELGLQTVNYKSLIRLNRGHGLAEFIDACIRIKRYNLEICSHCIIDIPFDDITDVIETAKIISALSIEQVKCHSLYILKDTELGRMFEANSILPISIDNFIERLITFLEYTSPKIVIQRLLGRAPEERSLFCNWGKSWWKIQEMIESKMRNENRKQGDRYDYLNGSPLFKAKYI